MRRQVSKYEGQEINTTGDGFILAFTGPTRAIQCAKTIRRELQSLELEARAGLHTGECERRGGDLSGIAVHIAARILDSASESDILVSNTVTFGSGVQIRGAGNQHDG